MGGVYIYIYLYIYIHTYIHIYIFHRERMRGSRGDQEGMGVRVDYKMFRSGESKENTRAVKEKEEK